MNKLRPEHLNKLRSDVESLKQMCQFTKLYLSNHFFELKAQVDLEMADHDLKQQMLDAEKKQTTKQPWIQMIATIESFESKCIHNKHSLNENLANIESIEAKLNDSNSLPMMADLKQLNKLIQAEEYRIEEILCQNQTIMFVGKDTARDLNHGKLMVITDEFVSSRGIEALKNM